MFRIVKRNGELCLQQAQSSDTNSTDTDGYAGSHGGSRVASVGASLCAGAGAGDDDGRLGVSGSVDFGARNSNVGGGGKGRKGADNGDLGEEHFELLLLFSSLEKN